MRVAFLVIEIMKNRIANIKIKIESLESEYYINKADKEKSINIIQELNEVYNCVNSQIERMEEFYELEITIKNNAIKIVEALEHQDEFGLLDIIENETKQILDIILELVEE